MQKTGNKVTLTKGVSIDNLGNIPDCYYAITVKYNKTVPEEALTKNYGSYIFDVPVILRGTQYEYDSLGKLHFHAYFVETEKFTFKHLFRRNYHVYIKKVHDLKGWKSYLKKATDPYYKYRKEQALAIAFYKTHYGFAS